MNDSLLLAGVVVKPFGRFREAARCVSDPEFRPVGAMWNNHIAALAAQQNCDTYHTHDLGDPTLVGVRGRNANSSLLPLRAPPNYAT